MKKEVQALIKRRRARLFPIILLSVAGLILVAIIVLVTWLLSGGVPGLPAATATLEPTVAAATPTVRPSATLAPATATASETPPPTETAGPSPTPTEFVYTVQEGDNLFTIAEEFSANVCNIMAVNGMTDPSVLAVGQTLIIPSADYEPPTPTALPTGLPRGARVEHVVQCGETLDTIAALYNSSGVDIADQNDIDDPLSIQIGQTLIVRVNLVTATPTVTATVTSGVPGTEAAATGTATRSP